MCRDHPNVDEGEHDFIVFGPDYIVLIEVKNPSIPQLSNSKSKNQVTSAIEKANIQFEKGLTLLQRISNCSQLENGDVFDIRVFRFVALPNISPDQSKDVNTDIINGDDFKDFKLFWRVNVENKESCMSEANLRSKMEVNNKLHISQSMDILFMGPQLKLKYTGTNKLHSKTSLVSLIS